jgi:hypothetical protein
MQSAPAISQRGRRKRALGRFSPVAPAPCDQVEDNLDEFGGFPLDILSIDDMNYSQVVAEIAETRWK